MTLTSDSIKWAIDFTQRHSDGDIFPSIIELLAISSDPNGLIEALKDKPLTNFAPQSCRRFIVPKDEVSYRQATQLHPQDSIILTALVYQYGMGIENRRKDKSITYSYRFDPKMDHGLYGDKSLWNEFWETAHLKSRSYSHILYCDIADFYNQIYHHTVENQLAESGFPNQAIKWVIKLLESTTAGVSRGVPIGPHAIHLLAECTLIPIDNSLSFSGLHFIRYADDIIVFCKSSLDAHKALSLIATTLDKQQRLMLQKHKTKVYSSDDFRNICREMIEDRPISNEEDRLLNIVRKYSGGDPYATITYNDISPDDWKEFSADVVNEIVREYLNRSEVDYIRLRWFFRRLTQVGHPGALRVAIDNIQSLGPCIANICSYIASIQSIPPAEWKDIGEDLLQLLESDPIRDNEFFRLSILSLFSKNEHINHFVKLAGSFSSSDPSARREILLSANVNNASDWLRELKENYDSMDQWQKMAFTYCVSALPRDEKKYFINRCSYACPFDEQLSEWAKNA
jgi:retron-type reverse transcriptase